MISDDNLNYFVAAPGKLNLCLHIGPTRPDGFHELVSLFDSVSLSDELTVRAGVDVGDRVVCETVDGDNLVQRALRFVRDAGLYDGPSLEVSIKKRVPIAAGMGGGSADAAAMLRVLAEITGRSLFEFAEVAFALGADVPSQLTPGAAIVHGAGERVVTVAPWVERAYVIVAQEEGLSTAEVFAQADRAELPEASVVDREHALAEALAAPLDLAGLCALVSNSLEPAIVALRPELVSVPDALRDAGAHVAAFTGSGPTCFGVFADHGAAVHGAAELSNAGHLAHAAKPVDVEFGRPRKLSDPV
ncbi:MAG: hypothetical protein WAP35_08520 [Solirubrobacterales bacterium]